MIEWMYQDRSAFNKSEATAEEYLLGKTVTEQDLHQSVKKQAALTEAYTTTENEAFLRMKDDPLVLIKQMEMEQRQKVLSNPLTLKKIREEIELLKNGPKKEKKDKKKHKKDKHRHRSRSNSSEGKYKNRSSKSLERSHRDQRDRRRRSSRSRSFEKPDQTKQREEPPKEKRDLGPDLALYKERM